MLFKGVQSTLLRGVGQLEGRVREGQNIVVGGTEEDSKEHEDTLCYGLNVYPRPTPKFRC